MRHARLASPGSPHGGQTDYQPYFLAIVTAAGRLPGRVRSCNIQNGKIEIRVLAKRSPLHLRVRLAMLLAALCADGTSTINNAQQIERGYERLNALGASIQRIPAG